MTKQEMRIAIAKSLGYNPTKDGYIHNPEHRTNTGLQPSYIELPNYPESLDACREFEEKVTLDEWEVYHEHLENVFENVFFPIDICTIKTKQIRDLFEASPEQRCIAFLKTKGLWK